MAYALSRSQIAPPGSTVLDFYGAISRWARNEGPSESLTAFGLLSCKRNLSPSGLQDTSGTSHRAGFLTLLPVADLRLLDGGLRASGLSRALANGPAETWPSC